LDEELAPRAHEATEFDQQGLPDDAALLVTLLPPRVRKMERDLVDYSPRSGPFEDLASVAAQHLNVRHPVLFEPLLDLVDPFGLDLDSDDSATWRGFCALEEGLPPPEPNIQLQRAVSRGQAIE
jgi:hypothetical protein